MSSYTCTYILRVLFSVQLLLLWCMLRYDHDLELYDNRTDFCSHVDNLCSDKYAIKSKILKESDKLYRNETAEVFDFVHHMET